MRVWQRPRSRHPLTRRSVTTFRRRRQRKSSTSIARCLSSTTLSSASCRRRQSSSWLLLRLISSFCRRRRRLNFSCFRSRYLFRSRFGSIRLFMWRRPQATLSSVTFTTRPSSTTMAPSLIRVRRKSLQRRVCRRRQALELARRRRRSPRKSLCRHPWRGRQQPLEPVIRDFRGKPPASPRQGHPLASREHCRQPVCRPVTRCPARLANHCRRRAKSRSRQPHKGRNRLCRPRHRILQAHHRKKTRLRLMRCQADSSFLHCPAGMSPQEEAPSLARLPDHCRGRAKRRSRRPSKSRNRHRRAGLRSPQARRRKTTRPRLMACQAGSSFLRCPADMAPQ